MKIPTIFHKILLVLLALSLVGNSTEAAQSNDTQKPELKPTESMPMWFYSVERQFKYPIPCDFEFAYIDSSGEIKVTGPFLKAYPYKDGLAKVQLGCYKLDSGTWKLAPGRLLLWVLIDKNGKIVQSAKSAFDSPHYGITFSSRSIKTKVVNGKKVIVMPELKMKVRSKSKHLAAGTIPEKINRFRLKFQEKWGYEDEDGNEYISAEYDFAYPFAEGFARVEKRSFAKTVNPILKEIKTLSESSKSSNEKTKKAAQQKLKILWKKYKKSTRNTDLIGYLNRKGDLVVPLEKYFKGRDFSDGLAAVYRGDKWGYIDSTGREVIEPTFEEAGDFGNGLAPISAKDKYGYVDKNGKIKIPFQFALAGKFVGGLAPATLDGISWGFINKTGKFAISPNYKGAFEFSDGLALVMIPPRNDIDKSKNEAANFYLSSVYFANKRDDATATEALKVAKNLNGTTASARVAEVYLERVQSLNKILKAAGYSINAKSSPTKNQ